MELSVKSYSLERKIEERKDSTFLFLLITARFTRKKLLESLKAETLSLPGVLSCDVLPPKSGVSLPMDLRAVSLGCPTILLEIGNAVNVATFVNKELNSLQERYKEALPRYSQTSHALLSVTAICKAGMFMDMPTYLDLESREGNITDRKRIAANIATNRTSESVVAALQYVTRSTTNLQQQPAAPEHLLTSTLRSLLPALINRRK